MIRVLELSKPDDKLNPVIFKNIFYKYGKLDKGNSGADDDLLSVSEFISLLREYGSELANFKVFKKDDTHYFFRLFDEQNKLIIESEAFYSDYSTIAPAPATRVRFKKKRDVENGDKHEVKPEEITISMDVLKEIETLKAFLAYELDLYCCEDPCDHNEDPYSFRISFVLPCWPKRFRDKGFRRFVEKTIQSETPAHIHAKVYWLGIEQMRQYEDAYSEWLIEMSCNDVPDISIANDFIQAVKGLKNCDEHCEADVIA